MPSNKICGCCGKSKSLPEDFHRKTTGKDGFTSKCKTCVKEYQANHRERTLQRERERHKKIVQLNPLHNSEQNLKRKFGMSLKDKEKLWREQNEKCGNIACLKPLLLFGRKEELDSIACVDHLHGTSTVRGLLCHDCNKALGYVRDSTNRLQGLVSYLTNFGGLKV